MKRTLSLVLALVMVLGTFTGVFAAEEATITPAEFLAKEGILQGADGDLMLDKNLERRDAVVLLSRLFGVEEEAKTFDTTEESPSWEDARTDAYYVPFFAWAEENGYFEGDDEGNFNPRNAITAPEYSLVLLRALGYEVNGHDSWKASLETAEKIGLLKDVEVEFADVVVRGQMAVMTFNALGAKMNGTNETLAEKLGIKMPVVEATELEVKVYSENLKEVIVELNNVELVNEEDLLNSDNYKIVRNTVKRVTLDEDKVLVELENELVKNESYELIIGGIDKALNKRHSFKAFDDTAPVVEKVEVLGEYGIKITASEPVEYNGRERSFSIDGKNIAMEVEEYGRVIILTPYYSASFPEDAKELTIVGLEDYAGFKSSVQKFDIEVNKDDVAPTVTGVELINDYTIEVTFDKDIYKNSVKAYETRKQLGNVSYGEGRHTVYGRPEITRTEQENHAYANKFETNKARYVFEERLPRNVDITVEGVQNHSKVAMEAVTERAVVNLDRRQPQVLDVDYTQLSSTKVRFKLFFDKNVEFDSTINKADGTIDQAKAKDHIEVYNGSVAKKDLVNDAEITRFAFEDNTNLTRNIVVIEIDGLKVNEKANNYGYDYILEIKNFVDNSFLTTNRMHVDYYDFELTPGTAAFRALDVVVTNNNDNHANTEVTIEFSKPVNRAIAEDATNYIFTAGTSKKDVAQFKGSIEVHRNGKSVTLIIPGKAYRSFGAEELVILETLKDLDGKRLDRSVFNFALGAFEGVRDAAIEELEALITKAAAAGANVTAANAVANDEDATLAQINEAIAALRKQINDNPTIKADYVENEMQEILTAKENELGQSIAAIAASKNMTEAEFLKAVEEAILAELKGVESLAKAGSTGTKATINGIEVKVVAELTAGGVEYKVYFDDALTGLGDTIKVTFIEKVYELKFTSNAKTDVTLVVYDADGVKVEPVKALTYSLPVGTYKYVAKAEGYKTLEGTVEFKKAYTEALKFEKVVTE